MGLHELTEVAMGHGSQDPSEDNAIGKGPAPLSITATFAKCQ